MPHSCIRLACILSPLIRQCYGFAAAPALKSIISSHISSPFQGTQTRFFSAFTLRAALVVSPAQSATEFTPDTRARNEHTPAQISRAASQAVRVAIRERNLRDAFYVVNSALQFPLERHIAPPMVSRRLLNPMNFRQGVPTRLVVHTLIHALMREGHTIRAGREIQKMVAMGVRFRSHTIEASVGLLCSGPSKSLLEKSQFPDRYERSKKPLDNDWNANRIIHGQSARLIPETRLALDLLSTARQSRRRRTERMYGWVVDACLLQGEIFVATLLFVVLVKDWQLRKVLNSSPVEPDDSTRNTGGVSALHLSPNLVFRDLRKLRLAKEIGLYDRDLKIPYPEKTILQSILNCIDRRLFASDSRTTSMTAKEDCEKSLTFLANLVDQRSLPFGQLSPLLRILYSYPRSRNKVHLLEDGRHYHVNAYDYGHQVLLRLCQALPSQQPKASPARPEMLPRLDTRAYNSLIHYALRHRLSPALADAVIEHMTIYRKPPLQPDIATYNILLNSASVLRRSGLADQVLDMLRKRHVNKDCATPKPRPRTLPPDSDLASKWGNVVHDATEQLAVPSIQTPSNDTGHYARVRPINADAYTLCSYITHLVRTGRPDVVADMIFDILPELHIIHHPANDSPSAHEIDRTREQWRALRGAGIRRAIEYGPYVFSTLLNALRKAGKTGLAERVWLLARQAERASWMQSDGADALAPWCLPIQAYTSMMQCYANESKKGVVFIRGSRYNSRLATSVTQEHKVWDSQRTGRTYVKGWAYFFLKMKAQEQGFRSAEPSLRWKTAREVGHLLLKSMETGAISVWKSLMTVQPENIQNLSPRRASLLDSLELPVRDARFYNAVLDVFGRRPEMQQRRVRVSPAWWSRKLRIAQSQYGESGLTSTVYDHTLVDIAQDMARAGYTLPLGLQRVLVGRVTFSVPRVGQQENNVRPFAFPHPKSLRSRLFSLPVIKSRGLPLGRRKPEVMRMRRVRERRERRYKANKLV